MLFFFVVICGFQSEFLCHFPAAVVFNETLRRSVTVAAIWRWYISVKSAQFTVWNMSSVFEEADSFFHSLFQTINRLFALVCASLSAFYWTFIPPSGLDEVCVRFMASLGALFWWINGWMGGRMALGVGVSVWQVFKAASRLQNLVCRWGLQQ